MFFSDADYPGKDISDVVYVSISEKDDKPVQVYIADNSKGQRAVQAYIGTKVSPLYCRGLQAR